MARKWFEITNAASEESATVSILDEIGMWGITAADFNREFKAIKANVVNLEINSPGGSVFDGLAIYNMLKASGKTINATVMGVAASIASIILMAADKITMPANSMVMVHSPAGGVWGTSDEMREFADVLDKVKASLIGVYMKRTGKTEDEVVAMLAKDTWMTAAEAKANGFADEVTDAVEMKASYDMDRLPENVRAVFKAAADAAAQVQADADAAAQADADAAALVATSKPVVPFADQVKAAATVAGFEAHAAAWSVTFTKMDDVTARIAAAREIKALCTVVDKSAAADGYIKAGKTLDEVRAAIATEMAAADEHIDTSKPNSNQPTKRAGPSAVTTAGMWAAHRNQTETGV